MEGKTSGPVSEEDVKKNLNVEKLLVSGRATIEAEFKQLSPNMQMLRKKILNLQNEYRKCHGVGPLQYSDTLSILAQDWSNHLANQNEFMHRSNCPVGENIACFSASSVDAIEMDEMVWLWYKEVNEYNWNVNNWQSGTGHFSQMVWKESQMLGIGLSFHGNTCMLVCNYYPRGNVLGHFPKNVFRRSTQPQKIILP